MICNNICNNRIGLYCFDMKIYYLNFSQKLQSARIITISDAN